MPSDFLTDLIDHKRRVGLYLQRVANALFGRAVVHDNSKFSPEEYEPYEEAFPGLQKYAYGTDEFKAELRKIKPAINHHYENNDHHAEFFENGINDMNLIQLVEMVCDWIAASERSQKDIFKGLEINKERFKIDDQLYCIIKNTVVELTRKSDGTDANTLYPGEVTIKINRLDGSCPVQAAGTINDHSAFYFRGRHEAWQFAAGPKELDTDGLVKVLIGLAEDPRVFVLRGDDEERLYLDYDHVRDALQDYAEQYIAWKAEQSVAWVKESKNDQRV